jgi:hypothetical protein
MVVLTGFLPFTGCASSPQQQAGMETGATAGALTGLFVGALRGRPLEGLATGAVVGGAAGYYDGWREENEDARARELASAIRESKAEQPAAPQQSPEAASRGELTRFLGMWALEGWALDDDGTRVSLNATVRGRAEMEYFVEMDFMDVQLNGSPVQLWGSSTIGYDTSQGYSISTRFNTLPTPLRARGDFDAASATFTLRDEGPERAVIFVQFQGPDRMTIETRISGQAVEAYTLVRI